jgi:hypothetical protein
VDAVDAQRSSTSLTSPVTPSAPTISPGVADELPAGLQEHGPVGENRRRLHEPASAFCSTWRERLSASAVPAVGDLKRMSEAVLLLNAFTRPPASSTMAASA